MEIIKKVKIILKYVKFKIKIKKKVKKNLVPIFFLNGKMRQKKKINNLKLRRLKKKIN